MYIVLLLPQAEKVEKMKAMGEERKAWLKAEAERKERELQAQEQERYSEQKSWHPP